MTATANIQDDKNTATQKITKIMEDGEMNNENKNINMVIRLSKAFPKGKIGKLIAVAALGLTLAAGVAMSSGASAPGSDLATNLNDDFSMVYGIPDTGLESGVLPASVTVAGYAEMSEENLEFVSSSVAGYGDMSEENWEIVPASFTIAGYAEMSEENLEIVPASFTVKGYAEMSEENLEIVPASFTVKGYAEMSEENLEFVPSSVAGYGDMSEENWEIVPARVTSAGYAEMSEENLEITG